MSYTGSRAFAGQGAQLQIDDGTGTNFTTIAEMTKVGKTGSKADFEDTTNMDSTSAYREVLPTLLDPGEVSFEGNWVPADATQQGLQTLFDGRTKRAMKIVLPGSLGHWAFNGYVVGADYELMVDKKAVISGKIKLTGAPTFTYGS